MHLVIDASVAVAEALRTTGRQLLRNALLRLFASSEVANETDYELRRRVESIVTRGHVSELAAALLLSAAQSTIADAVTPIPRDTYADRIADATWRILRDPNDVSTIALALTLDCGIWTSDRDFFGCGLPVWSTEVLRRHVELSRGGAEAGAPSG
jgi:predicted nucleic acid-binding protein